MLNVFIVTYCQNMEDLWGNLMVFKTLRTGFPTADIYVIDNGSIGDARKAIRAAIEPVGGVTFLPSPVGVWPVAHHLIITQVLNGYARDVPSVFVDPDMIFYEKVEDWKFRPETLLAGRLLPRFCDEFTGTITQPRLHTSLMWVPKPKELREAIRRVQERQFEWYPWLPVMLAGHPSHQWQRWDTGAQFYALFPKECEAFTPEQRDAYTHVFCGTSASYVLDRMTEQTAKRQLRVYKDAIERPEILRGLWREQEEYFLSRRA